MEPMDATILCESAGWVLFEDGQRLVFADRGTSYRRVLLFVLALLALIAGVNGFVWLIKGLRSGEMNLLGILLAVAALLSALGVGWLWQAEKRQRAVIPDEATWIAVLDLATQTFETPQGESLAPLANVRFEPAMQLASSSRALRASWPGGDLVVYRGSPFAGSYKEALEALSRHGVRSD